MTPNRAITAPSTTGAHAQDAFNADASCRLVDISDSLPWRLVPVCSLRAHGASLFSPRTTLLRACGKRRRSCCAAQCEYEFSPSDVDCHATPPAGGRVHANRGGRYHALAKERTMLLRCESLEPSMSRLGQTEKSSTRANLVRFTPDSDSWADIP